MGLKEAHPQSVEVSGQKSVSLLSDEELNARVASLIDFWEKDGDRVRFIHDNYCHDLNAMHEAEKMILAQSDGVPPPDLWDNYYANLQQGHSIIIHADARRRAEAFVITMSREAYSVSDLPKSDSASINPK